MKIIKATTNFTHDGKFYEKGDEVNTKDIKAIVVMNERGYIEPLTAKDIQNIKADLNKPKEVKVEEE